MKKQYKIIVVCIIALLGLRVCLSNEKKKENNVLKTSNQKINIAVVADFSNATAINTKVFGINIGFAFQRELDKDSGFVQLLRAMHPASLRFPGGTVANWYHPELPVYGFKAKEIIPSLGGLYNIQSQRSENILYNFIRLCKAVNCGAVFCANMLTGTTDEALFVIDKLKENNIPILGVELGNEYFLMAYRKQFPNAPTYIERVKATALAIRKKYPELRIAAVSGDVVEPKDNSERGKFMRNWSLDLSKENFYDAYVWHFYAGCTNCDQSLYFDSVFVKNLNQMAAYQTQKIYSTGVNFIQLYGKERKLWITEWNVSNEDYLSNTFMQGAYVSEAFLNMIELNAKYNNYIELTNLHAMDGIVNIYKGKQTPVFSIGNDNATVQYFAFKFLASTLTEGVQRGETKLSSTDNAVVKDVICQAFFNKKDNKTYLHFVNRSGKHIALTVKIPATTYIVKSVEADVPYATAGKTSYEKKYPNKVTPIRYIETLSKNNTISIAPYAFGYIEIN